MVDRDTVEFTAQQRLVRDSIRDICSDFDRAYWRERDREVFGRPIGTSPAIQHSFGEAHAHVHAAKSVVYDVTEAAAAAVGAHGDVGVTREYDVERYFREARLTRLVPIT